ncbi:MAG: hypothetical protein V1793_05945 [Pseudomonadota bacterium]
MPSVPKHIEISKERTGKSYQEVHEWIDDPDHKNERHDITKIPDNFQMFKGNCGEEAAREYVQHLSDDLSGRFGHVVEDVETAIKNALAYFGSK